MHFKNPIGLVGADLEVYYDQQYILKDAESVRFFPPNPTGDITEQNYDQNPLPGPEPHSIVALGFHPLLPIVKEDTGNNIYPQRIYNVLSRSIVKLTIDNDRELVWRHPLSYFVDLDRLCFRDKVSVNSENTVTRRKSAFWPNFEIRQLSEPFLIPPQKSFKLTIELGGDTSLLPTEAQWTSAAQGGNFGFRAVMQYGLVRKPG